MLKYFVLFVFIASAAYSQFVEDALRYTQTDGIITARAAGLNVSYHGLSDDMAALYYNPAGLSLIANNELSFGFGFKRNATETDFLNNAKEFTSNNGYITNIGFASPFSTSNGNGAVAISYFREANFNNNIEFAGFNESSSFISNSVSSNPNIETNIPFQMFLVDENANGDLYTVYDGQLAQEGFITQDGGIHNISGGAGWDIQGNFSIGFNLTAKWGGLEYRREYSEVDINNVYNSFDPQAPNLYEDLSRFDLTEQIEQNMFGLSGSIGMMSRIGEFMRVGATIKLPSYYEVDERFKRDATAKFDNGEETFYAEDEFSETSYKVNTPFVYAAGASLNALGMVFTAGVEYRDVSQIEFSDATDAVLALNPVITRELVGQTTWGFGAEYDIPLLPFVARASFQSTTSPYQEDIAGATMNMLSLGGSVFLAENIRLDGVFRWSDVTQLQTVYADAMDSRYQFTNNPLNIALTLTYRY